MGLLNHMDLLEEEIGRATRTGVLVFDSRAEQTAAPLKRSPRFIVKRSESNEEAVFACAQSLVDEGCDLIVVWGLADGVNILHPAGALVVPTRVIDTKAGEAFETSLRSERRNERVVMLSTLDLGDQGTKRRLAMRYQAVAADVESALVARFSCWNDVPFAVVRCIADTTVEAWADNTPSALHQSIRNAAPQKLKPWVLPPRKLMRRLRELRSARKALRRTARALASYALES